jgi:hypothetical protein
MVLQRRAGRCWGNTGLATRATFSQTAVSNAFPPSPPRTQYCAFDFSQTRLATSATNTPSSALYHRVVITSIGASFSKRNRFWCYHLHTFWIWDSTNALEFFFLLGHSPV